jgi:UDP-N-acetylmuramoylalanine--D-glutamate ligase
VKRLAILGAGRSGRAAEALAARSGLSSVVLTEGQPLPPGGIDRVIVSPGIPLTHPWLAACRARHLPVVSELQFGVEACRERAIRLLAVTGSKGKSSVVKAVADALNRCGRSAVACGNYGTPVSAIACAPAVDWAVVEVSSFQLETTTLPGDTFEAATILNLQEDHLDRHGDVATYHALKKRLLAMAKRTVAAAAEDFPPQANGSYFDNPVLRANGAAVAGLLRAAGLSPAQGAEALRRFEPLAHRMQTVAEIGGVRCINDSKATSLSALAAGVTMAGGGVRLIAGGQAKGDDPLSVTDCLTKHVKKVYLIGGCAESFRAAWSGVVPCEMCGTLSRAVSAALQEARRGETLLLSPGTASFDQFESFEQRGEMFASLVQQEGQKKK